MGKSLKNPAATQEITSRVAYLIGVSKNSVKKDPVYVSMYDELNKNKNARIIRNLCIIRSAILMNWRELNSKLKNECTNIYFATEFFPAKSLSELSADGVEVFRDYNKTLVSHMIEINRTISDRINNCKDLFPIWLDWSYVRDFFIMPDGLSQTGIEKARRYYTDNRTVFPFQMYINWKHEGRGGHIFYSDKVLVSVIYNQHNDTFTDLSKVGDADCDVKSGIYDFIEGHDNVIIAVDCENSDPYKMCATLTNLDEVYTSKISKIILIDDINASSAWKILEDFTNIPIEYRLIERLLKGKSLVDITLSSIVCKEHYQNGVDSVILFSSDSDYWGLSSNLPEVSFYVMVESGSVSPEYKKAIRDAGMDYCYIDDFFTGNSQDIKFKAIFKELGSRFKNLGLNANTILDDALKSARAVMPPAERKQFYDKYLKKISVSLDEEGNFCFSLVN